MNTTSEPAGTATTQRTERRTLRSLTPATAAGLTAFALTCASATPTSARQDLGIGTGWAAAWQAAPVTVARIDNQIIRCDTGEGNLGGAGARAPLTLPSVTTCSPSTAIASPSAEQARQLERDPLR